MNSHNKDVGDGGTASKVPIPPSEEANVSTGPEAGSIDLKQIPMFLDNPPEIRNRIYHFILLGLCAVVNHKTPASLRNAMEIPCGCPGKRHGWQYYDPDKQRQHFGPVLLTCRTIAREFRVAIYREVFFFFERHGNLVDTYLRHTLHPNYAMPLKTPVQALTNPVHWMRQINLNFSSPAVAGSRIDRRQSETMITQAMDIVTFSMPKLRRLQLEIDFRANVFDGDRLLKPWFIRTLCRLGILEYFGITFTDINHRTRSMTKKNADVCVFAVQGVISWFRCGAAQKAQTTIQNPLDQHLYSDKALSLRFANEMVFFLKRISNGNSATDHTVLISLLEEDIRKLSGT